MLGQITGSTFPLIVLWACALGDLRLCGVLGGHQKHDRVGTEILFKIGVPLSCNAWTTRGEQYTLLQAFFREVMIIEGCAGGFFLFLRWCEDVKLSQRKLKICSNDD